MVSPARRGLLLGLGSVIVVGALAVGWVLATLFQSPSQIAAASAAPPKSTVSSVVEIGDLSRHISIKGAMTYASTETIRLGGNSPGAVATKTIEANSQLQAGQVVAEINGRPVFVFRGEFPLYRELRLGDRGPDVVEIQNGLAQAGYEIDVDGTLGPGTRTAVEDLYRAAGYGAEHKPAVVSEAPPNDTSSASKPIATAGDVIIGLDDFAIVPDLPAQLSNPIRVGAITDDNNSIGVSAGNRTITANVSAGTARQMRTGISGNATIGTATSLAVTLKSIATEPAKDGTVTAVFSLDAAAPANVESSDVTIDVLLTKGGGQSLIVPTKAVITRGDSSFVRKITDGGAIKELKVQVLASDLGRTSISISDTESLKAGDRVIIR